jgi:hypothetical protein
MASLSYHTPGEDEVTEAVLDALNHMDTTAIANAILDDRRFADCIDQDALQTYDLADVLNYAIPDAIGKDTIVSSIMMYLRDVIFESEQVPQSSPLLDATMLREQILGTCPHHVTHLLNNVLRSYGLTVRTADAGVLHTLYRHVSPAVYDKAEVIVTSHFGKGRYSAHVVRTRQSPAGGKAGLAVTIQVKGYKTQVEALEALLDVSRRKLTDAFEASENLGGRLGNWELLELN